ncbi:acyl carrier protein [Pendulispora albinea]|uniref:Acyl carrier protein n=1 Tax=Pendulispora albinea TaxID=2741071 RepID=A0ABZ2MAF2_9BACT
MSLRALVSKVLREAEENVSDDASPKTLKSWNSTKHVELIMAVERNYKVRFSTAEIVTARSLKSIRDLLVKHGVSE